MGDSSIEAAPDATSELELTLHRERPLRLRDWFIPFALVLGGLVGVWFAYGDVSRAAALAGFLAYMSVACTFLPLPTTPWILWAASGAAAAGPGFSPWLVATLGALGTGVANMHDYYIVTALYRLRPVRKVKVTGVYRRFAGWFNRNGFASLAAASFLPIPIDVVRLLAISEGYPRWKFAIGSVVGRWPRYLALAILADRLDMGWQWILGIGGATVVLGLWRGVPPLVSKVAAVVRAEEDVSNEQDDETEKEDAT